MTLLYALLAALAVSAMSLIGILTFLSDNNLHKRFSHALLALAAGAMLGNALLHLLPHALTMEMEAAAVQVETVHAPAANGTNNHGHAAHAHDHDGHDHGKHGHHDHDGHDHAKHGHHDHDGHDHGKHGHHDHDGHDHGKHDHHDHDGHAHDHTCEHGCNHDHGGGWFSWLFSHGHEHHGHDHGDGHGHGHTGVFVAFLMLAGMLLFHALDISLKRMAHHSTDTFRTEGWLVIVGDAIENLLDGIVIGAAFLLSVPAGIAATITVMLHEIPLELGDFAVLRHSGFSKTKALLANFASGLVSLVGVVIAVVVGSTLPGFALYATPIAAGAFLYIAACILIPHVRKESATGSAFLYFGMTVLGIVLMALIMLLE